MTSPLPPIEARMMELSEKRYSVQNTAIGPLLVEDPNGAFVCPCGCHAALAETRRERDEAIADRHLILDALKQGSGAAFCFYCNTSLNAEDVRSHAESCTKHPVNELRARLAEAEAKAKAFDVFYEMYESDELQWRRCDPCDRQYQEPDREKLRNAIAAVPVTAAEGDGNAK